MKTQQNSTSLGQHGTSAWLVNPLFCWYSMDTLRILAIDASFMQRTAEFVINCCVKIVPLVSMGFWRAVAGEYCTCVRLLYTCFIDVRHTMSCYNQVLVKRRAFQQSSPHIPFCFHRKFTPCSRGVHTYTQNESVIIYRAYRIGKNLDSSTTLL